VIQRVQLQKHEAFWHPRTLTALTGQATLETRFIGLQGLYLIHRVTSWSTGFRGARGPA
jgi:hypothetical protein